jgi:hypothetical protein
LFCARFYRQAGTIKDREEGGVALIASGFYWWGTENWQSSWRSTRLLQDRRKPSLSVFQIFIAGEVCCHSVTRSVLLLVSAATNISGPLVVFMATTTKKDSKNKKARLRRPVVKTSTAKQAPIIAELR